MNELTRMQYLDAMGIDMFVPTMRLSNAKVSVLCPLPEAEILPSASNEALSDIGSNLSQAQPSADSPIKATSIVASSLSEATSPVAVANVLADLRGDAKPNRVPAPNPTVSSDEQAASPHALVKLTPAKFTLGMWRVGTHLQVLDSRAEGDALPTDVLLRNILRAHDLLPQSMPSQEILHWPLPGVALSDTSWAAAHEMVMSFLEGRLLANPVTHFVLFGEDAFCALMGEAEAANFTDALYQTVAVDAFAADAIVLPSLRYLLNNPLEKKLLWPIMQLLSHRIDVLFQASES